MQDQFRKLHDELKLTHPSLIIHNFIVKLLTIFYMQCDFKSIMYKWFQFFTGLLEKPKYDSTYVDTPLV